MVTKVKATSVKPAARFWHAHFHWGGYWHLVKDSHGRPRRYGSAQAARAAAERKAPR